MAVAVFIIHGTEGSPQENWFPWLQEKLEQQGCHVFVPQFPSPPGVPVKSAAWFDILKNYKEHINSETIFIAHSLGGIFLLRVLEKLKGQIRAAFFVATPIGIRPILNYDRDNIFSGFSFAWEEIKKKAQDFVVFHSDTDPYVGLENGKELAKKLGIDLSFIANAGHFNAKAGYLKFEALAERVLQILKN